MERDGIRCPKCMTNWLQLVRQGPKVSKLLHANPAASLSKVLLKSHPSQDHCDNGRSSLGCSRKT